MFETYQIAPAPASGRVRPSCLALARPWLALLGLLFVGASAAAGADTPASKMDQIKAAFLYNFTKFVEWPTARFADGTSPIVIGMLGRNSVGDELEKIVAGRSVNGRAIQVKTVHNADEVPGVHLLFVPAGEENRLVPEIWQNVGIVVVGESEHFAALGGTITFRQVDDKIRFEINLAAAEQSRLKISAQLLKLATAVRRKI